MVRLPANLLARVPLPKPLTRNWRHQVSISLSFEPDADRAKLLDRRMHASLASSLEHLCEAARGAVSFDEGAITRLAESLRGDRCYPPILFRDYFFLADALLEDDAEMARRQFDRVANAQPASCEMRVSALEDPERSAESAIYQALMTADPTTDIAILPPSPDVAGQFIDRFGRGMKLMDSTIPELAGEVRAIVREVVCVAGDPSRKMQFDGGSHFQLWGALFLNAGFHPTELAIVEVVAHESAHSLLFGFCVDEPLVYNDDDDLFPSPLRVDPRPMDGIYHATFVSARMHWAMSRLLASGALSEEQRAEAEKAREADARNFAAGYQVVSEHGDLSPTGAGLIEGARAYMSSVRE